MPDAAAGSRGRRLKLAKTHCSLQLLRYVRHPHFSDAETSCVLFSSLLGVSDAVRQAPLQLFALPLGEGRLFGLLRYALLDRLRQRETVLGAETVDPKFLQGW